MELRKNGISGTIPRELKLLVRLGAYVFLIRILFGLHESRCCSHLLSFRFTETLDLATNSLQGSIPSSLGEIKTLGTSNEQR